MTDGSIQPSSEDPRTGSLLYLALCAFASALGGLLFGYDMFVIAGAKDLIVAHYQLTSLMEGWFVSSAMVGAMLGCFLAGGASDRLGRKTVLVAAAVFLLVSALGCGVAWSESSAGGQAARTSQLPRNTFQTRRTRSAPTVAASGLSTAAARVAASR